MKILNGLTANQVAQIANRCIAIISDVAEFSTLITDDSAGGYVGIVELKRYAPDTTTDLRIVPRVILEIGSQKACSGISNIENLMPRIRYVAEKSSDVGANYGLQDHERRETAGGYFKWKNRRFIIGVSGLKPDAGWAIIMALACKLGLISKARAIERSKKRNNPSPLQPMLSKLS